jgi:uncharacterized protein (TIGR02145 family)
MAENLKTTKYQTGVLIGTTTPATLDISGESAPTYQWAYAGNEGNVATYGRLYTWYAVTDSRNVCPTGWHVPTDAEWTTLENYLIASGFNYDGTTTGSKEAKAMATTSGWVSSTNTGAVGNTDYPAKRNATGFSALPAGYRYYTGAFSGATGGAYFWSTTESSSWAWDRSIYFSTSTVDKVGYNKVSGLSVRCLKD